MTRFLRICLVLVGILPLCRAESWTISVHTGRKRYAGTDCNVYIRLFDPRDVSSREYHLTHRNWIPENNAIPIRNLFEMGAQDRFHIRTEGITTVAKITIRRDNYPLLQPDWLLDQVIVKRDDDDSARYVFTCNCWLRGEQLQVTLSALPDAQSDKRNKHDAAASSYKRAFVVILLLFICTVIGVFCCYNEYRRRQQQQHSPPPSSETSPPDLHGSSLLDECQPQPAGIESRADYWMNTLRQWKTLPQRFSTDRHARTPQPVSTAVPPDEPPSYEDLYPNQNAPMNNRSNF